MEVEHTKRSLAGVILAGGNSQRMGRDKALLQYRGKPFIQLITEILQSLFKEVLIVSDNGEGYQFLKIPILKDLFANCGPLAGIHSAFVNSNFNEIFVVSTDLPLIESSAVEMILHQRSSAEVIVYSVDNNVQPLFGLYNRSCLPMLENHLRRKQYSATRFLSEVTSYVIPVTPSTPFNVSRILTNINTPEDYQKINLNITNK